jgi:predicted lipid-binding transport protein (Tim44 family)
MAMSPRSTVETSVFTELHADIVFFFLLIRSGIFSGLSSVQRRLFMKKALALFAVVLTLGLTVVDAEAARRLGGGKSTGMQRQTTTQPATGAPNNATPAQTAPATAAAPAAGVAPGAAAAAAPKRSWMGPIAGLAAGLGLAALASHFGFGEALANMMMIGLLVMGVLLLIGFVMRKRAAGQSPAMAGAGGMGTLRQSQPQQDGAAFRTDNVQQPRQGTSLIGSRIGSGVGSTAPVAAAGAGHIPADFDVASFTRNAKSNFLGLQAANDAGDLNRLREYLTPEMFEIVRADLLARGDVPLKTEVFGLDAQLLDVAEDADRYVVSVRFTGSVREEVGAPTEDLNEVWHLTKPRAGSGGWLVAGIQQA